MRKFLKFLFRTVELVFIVLCFLVISMFFREFEIPGTWVEPIVEKYVSTNLVIHADSIGIGFKRGVVIRGLRVYDVTRERRMEAMASADELVLDWFGRHVEIVGARYPRLPDSYYAPGNLEKNQSVMFGIPEIPTFTLTLLRPDILGVRPASVIADVAVTKRRIAVERIHLDWPETAEAMFLNGFCTIDLDQQQIIGEVRGSALQTHIRPLLVCLDLPVSLPYVDAFTDVRGEVPSSCGWKVNLINNDFTLDLGLDPTLGKYNGVSMKHATGDLHLFVYTRGTFLNYRHQFGPIHAIGMNDEPLNGTVWVEGTNGTNTVTVQATSRLPVASLMKIGGFTGHYVDKTVFGDASGKLTFKFPRAMTNNYEALNGHGHLQIKDGQLMRLKGFRGLVSVMPTTAPAVSWFADSTQGSCDYVIKNGVLKSDNIYIEGSVFSIKMYGQFDAVHDKLDFTARVQFTKRDSFMGKLLHPLAWPFTKLLLEFRLTGSAENPEWKYISVIDRVLEAAP